MGRRGNNRRPGNSAEDRLRQQQADKERRSALVKKMQAKAMERAALANSKEEEVPESRFQRDEDAYLSGLASTPLRRLGSNSSARLAPWYQTFIELALKAMNDGDAQVVMSWPFAQTCSSGIASLVAIAAVSSAKRTYIDIQGEREPAFEQADEFRAVLFPYARSTHTAARQVQVDGMHLGSVHFDHLKRCLYRDSKAGTKEYHQVLSRLRKTPERRMDGVSNPAVEHPILDELVPHGPAVGEKPANSELLWRTRNKTDIKKFSISGAADDPDTAAYFIFTIRANDLVGVQLKAIKAKPDLVIIDLSRTARARLGWNWKLRAKDAIKCVHETHPDTGIIALTDDPWVYRSTRFQLLGLRKPGKKGKTTPASGRVVFAQESSIVVDKDQSQREFEGATEVSVDGFFGEVDRSIERLRELAKTLTDRGSALEAATVREVIAVVRRSACLPGSLAAFSRFLENETTAAVAADLLASFRIAGRLSELSDSRSLASQLDAGSQATAGLRDLMRTLENATPMASLLDEAVQAPLRSSSRSIWVFRSDMIAEFAASQLKKGNSKLQERLEKDMMRFGGGYLVAAVSGGRPAYRNQFKRVILVAPTRSAILATFAKAWLPEHVVILADADTLLFAAKDAERLASELGEESVARRLRDFAEKAHTRVAEIGRHVVRFDSAMIDEDVDFPTDRLVDLSGGGHGERNVVQIVMHNGQRILARPSTHIVIRNDGPKNDLFIEKLASEICVGDEVCVIGPAFIERARTLVNIRVTAAEEIREYHGQVVAKFGTLPGHSVSERLRHLVSKMGEPEVSPHTARYWVSLDQELEKELEDVVPHAPHDLETFLRFTGALGIGVRLAENFWRWAVVAQRSHRMRVGNIFHDAFRGVLTDPHAALAENAGRAEEMRTLRVIAEEYVVTVAQVGRVETV